MHRSTQESHALGEVSERALSLSLWKQRPVLHMKLEAELALVSLFFWK